MDTKPISIKKSIVGISQAINEHEMTLKHWGLWLITGAGFALDGFDLFIIGVAMPLLMQQYTWALLHLSVLLSALVYLGVLLIR